MLWFHLFSWQNIQIWSSLAEKKPPISTHLNKSIISKYDVIKCFFGSKCIQWPLYSTTFVFVADQFIILYCPCAPTQGFASLGHVRSCHPNVKTTEQFVYQGLWLIHLLWRSHMSRHLLRKSVNLLGNILLSRRVAGARTPVLLYRFTNVKIDCLVVVTLCLRCTSLWICTAEKPFFEYSIIKCRVDIDNLLALSVAIYTLVYSTIIWFTDGHLSVQTCLHA